jgi:hypothetical protein
LGAPSVRVDENSEKFSAICYCLFQLKAANPLKWGKSSGAGGAGLFHTTHWTLVMASAHYQSQIGRAALAALCQIYWYPLYAFARGRGHSPHDAQDLTQGFFLQILEHRALSQVGRLKGALVAAEGWLQP